MLAAAYSHTCAIDLVGAIVCWGSDTFGQLDAPAGVFTEISAGGNMTIAKRADGVVVAWGENSAGQTVVPDSVQPVSPSPGPEPDPTPPHFTG
jgi:alpha-tubulin suppressor-like RCC1 family protein